MNPMTWRRSRPVQCGAKRLRLMSVLVALAGAAACGGPQKAGELGDECFRADDCSFGLVCVQGFCSNDLTDIVSTVDGPAGEGGVGGAAAGAAGAAGSGAGA